MVIGCVVLATAAAVPSASPQAGNPLTGSVRTYSVVRGDTLRRIGARFGVDLETLAADNQLPSRAVLKTGQSLRVDNRHIVPPVLEPGLLLINIPQRMAFLDSGRGVEGVPVAVGRRDWRTPLGPFTIVVAEENPTWDVPISIQEEARRAGKSLPTKVPPGPDNPLGEFWLGLSFGGIGLHGTNAPASVYGAVTHGCIRMHPEDVARLFTRVAVGTAGRTIYEPVLMTAAGGEIYLEVHRDVYGLATADPRTRARALADALGLTQWVDWDAADRVIEAHHGVARPVARLGPSPSDPRPAQPTSSLPRAEESALASLVPQCSEAY